MARDRAAPLVRFRRASGRPPHERLLGTLLAAALVFLAGAASAASPSDFSKPYAGVAALKRPVPLLVVLLRPDDPAHMPNRTQAQVRNSIFGPRKSVRTYFHEVSYGWFTVDEAAVTPWLVARDDPKTSDWDESTAAYVHTSDIERKGAWLIRQVEAMTSFRFADYDRDGDGRVRADELAVLWIYPGDANARGRVTNPAVVAVPSLSRGVELGYLIRGGDRVSWATVAHELGHQILGLGDLYVDNAGYPGVGRTALMCDQAQGTHPEPWARIKLGWLEPAVAAEDGWYSLSDVERHPEALILHDPQRGTKDYFIVENRWPGSSHEDFLGTRGLALWRIAENGEARLPGRRTIDLAWAAGPPAAAALAPGTCPSRNDAFFDGAMPATAYAPSPSWRDGSASDIAIWHVPPASPQARFYVDLPPRQNTGLAAAAVAMAGSSRDLDRHRAAYSFSPAPGRSAAGIVGMGIASDDRVYAWYRDGSVSAGNSANLANYRNVYRYSLPPGKTPADIVGMGIASDDHVYAWYRDGSVSAGTSADLDAYRPRYGYTLPPGYRPDDIVGMGIASDDHVHAWYRDGMASTGDSSDLDRYRPPYRFTQPLGRVPDDVIGMGIANDDHVYSWLASRGAGAPIVLTAHAAPGGVVAGSTLSLIVKAANPDGRPLPGVSVAASATAGNFVGPATATTGAAGLAQLVWRAPATPPTAHGGRVLLELRATRGGFAHGRAQVDVPFISTVR